MLDLANLETDTIFDIQLLEETRTEENTQVTMLLLFATNGTVLVLSQASSAYKIKTVYNLLPLIGGVDDDMVQYTKVFKLSERLRMFLVLCTEGMLIYQLDEEESDGQSSGVINKMYSA